MLQESQFINQRVPSDPKDWPDYLDRQFRGIAGMLEALAAGQLVQTNVAPDKPRDGFIRYAAGAPGWDPGSGEGIYAYYAGVWNKL